MLFSKVLQQLLVPSSFIIVLVILSLIFFLFRKKGLAKFLLILTFLLYYAFSITPVTNLLLLPLESKYSPISEAEVLLADKIVILLGGREADVLRGSEVLRIYHLKDKKPKVIISGTDPLLSTSEEALGVKRFFVSRGLKEEDIIIEGQSHNTWENIRNVIDIVKADEFFLVTSAYHMERAKREFEKMEVKVIPAPTDFKMKTEEYSVLDYLPKALNFKNSDLAIHEYLGILWYKVKS